MKLRRPALILSLSIIPFMFFGCAAKPALEILSTATISHAPSAEEWIAPHQLIIPAAQNSWVDLILVDAYGSRVALGHFEPRHGCSAKIERVNEFGGEALRIHSDGSLSTCDIKIWAAWTSQSIEATVRYEWNATAESRVEIQLQ